MNFIANLPTTIRPWQLLTLVALLFELTALFFQYAMGLAPCIMCIYQRVAIWSIFLAGIIGIFAHQYLIGRALAYGLWGVGAFWGFFIALEHVEMQSAASSFFFSCEFVPNFPIWAPLHQWLPFLFEATGDCGDINWQFFGYSMPQWMTVIYGAFSLALVLVIACRLFYKRAL